MKARELLTEGISKKETYDILHNFVRFAAKHLELETLPKMEFKFDTERAVEHASFGGYAPGDKHIAITVGNRHIMDVCRTLAHEMVHFKQDLDDKLNDPEAGKTGSPQENEANAEAAIIMRNWGRANPEFFNLESIG